MLGQQAMSIRACWAGATPAAGCCYRRCVALRPSREGTAQPSAGTSSSHPPPWHTRCSTGGRTEGWRAHSATGQLRERAGADVAPRRQGRPSCSAV